MATCYRQQKPVQPFVENVWNIFIYGFETSEAVEIFVAEKLGAELANSINWDQSVENASFDLLMLVERHGCFDRLIGVLQEQLPDDTKLAGVIARMVKTGTLVVVQ